MKWGFSFRNGFVVLSCFAALILTVPGAGAQLLQGTIDGNVMDSSQAAIAGALVTAKDQQTNFTRETMTNEVGGYSLPGLPPGTYMITVSLAGFQSYTQTDIAVVPNTIRRVDVTLTVGTVTENVTVVAAAAALQTDRAEIRSEVTGNTLINLPVPIGRNYQLLMPTLPGVSDAQNANSFAANPTRSVNFSVNGTPTNINNFSIDGTNSRGVIDSTFTYIPALETVQEVTIVTNSFDAEQGLAGGAAIALQIKSGSNDVHGSLFGFHTDQHMKAYQWAADRSQPKPKYINNQYGATIGGPIKKDKLFYFLSYEGTNYSENVTQAVQVPTLAKPRPQSCSKQTDREETGQHETGRAQAQSPRLLLNQRASKPSRHLFRSSSLSQELDIQEEVQRTNGRLCWLAVPSPCLLSFQSGQINAADDLPLEKQEQDNRRNTGEH